MNIIECKHANEGVLAFRAGKGISDNPYVAGQAEPFEEANKWHSGYLLEMLRASEAVDEETALNLGEASWLSSRFPARLEIIDKAIVALTRHNEPAPVYA